MVTVSNIMHACNLSVLRMIIQAYNRAYALHDMVGHVHKYGTCIILICANVRACTHYINIRAARIRKHSRTIELMDVHTRTTIPRTMYV